MKCSNCGKDTPEGMSFCGNCGKPFAPQPVPSPGSQSRFCVECGRAIDWAMNRCMYCGHDYTLKPKVGDGGYLITGGILTILGGIIGLAILSVMIDAWGLEADESMIPAVISVACCVLGLVGGFAALSRAWFPLAVLGAACAIFSPAFYFAIPGLVLIVRSANRFKGYEG